MTEREPRPPAATQNPPLGGMGGADDTDYGTDIGGVGATVGTDDDVIATDSRWTEENADLDRGGALGSSRPGVGTMGGGAGASRGQLGRPSQTPGGSQTQGRQGAIRGDSGQDARNAGIHGESRTSAGIGHGSASGPSPTGGAPDSTRQPADTAELGGGQSARGSSYGGTGSLAGGSGRASDARATGRGAEGDAPSAGDAETIGPSRASGADRASQETPQGMDEVGRE